ncbi:hypothetical protein [Ralstonia pickettii]|uniref:hypothetical protein n=1 Tax=Ralstonia pickettii TaxID=329 RepID=UPI0015BA7039|nr:hypothetical protein [Ralstonia pickettii]NWK42825.1 hypothetical protein [Ralstonia pickettii]
MLRLEKRGKLGQLSNHVLAFRSRRRQLSHLRLDCGAQSITLCFHSGSIGARLVECELGLFAAHLQLANALRRGPGFGDQPRAILVQLRDLSLLDDQRLVGLPDFRLQLLNLLLVPAGVLIPLLLAGIAEVLQCLVWGSCQDKANSLS